MRYFLPSLLRLLCFLLLLSAARSAAGQVPGWQWATSPGKGGGYDVATDAAGNVYMTGGFIGTATFGTTLLRSQGNHDFFLAKLSPSGTYLWAVRAGGTHDEYGLSLILDAIGNVYVAGMFTSSAATFGPVTLNNRGAGSCFVAKLNSAGAWQWAVQTDGAGFSSGGGLSVGVGGDIYITGTYQDTTSFGATTLSSNVGQDMFVAKLSPAGAWQWAVGAGGNLIDVGMGTDVDALGNVYVVGYLNSPTATFGPTTLTSAYPTRTNDDAFVAKLSPAGAWLWAVRGGGESTDLGRSIAVDVAGNVYVAGDFSRIATFGTISLTADSSLSPSLGDAFVAKLSPAGAWLWAERAGGDQNDGSDGIAVDLRGNVYVAGVYGGASAAFGDTTLASAGSYDVFVAKLDSVGVWKWAVGAGGTGDEFSFSVSVDATGNAFVIGHFRYAPTTTFGAITLANSTPGDALFLARLGVNPLGIPIETVFSPFTLAPNPAHHTVALTGLLTETTATLFDALGRAVRTAPLSAGAATLDVRGLAAGVYVVRAGAATRRLVVE